MAETYTLEILRALQGDAKARIKALKEEVEKFRDESDVQCEIRLKIILKQVKDTSNSAKDWNSAAIGLIDVAQVPNEVRAQVQLANEIEEIIIIIDNYLSKLASLVQPLPNKSHGTTKLPSIALPYFDGQITEFPAFFDAFRVIDEDATLSNAVKLTYLIGQLQGRALNTLSSFSRIDANYVEARDLLKNKYGDENAIINTYIDNIINIKQTHHDFTSFEKFVGIIESNCRQLNAMDPKLLDNNSEVLARIIENKLPPSFKEYIDRNCNIGRWKLSDLRKEINKELSHLESVNSTLRRRYPKWKGKSGPGIRQQWPQMLGTT